MFLNLQNPVVREWPASPAATSHRRIVASSHRRIVASSHRRIVASSHRRIVALASGGISLSFARQFCHCRSFFCWVKKNAWGNADWIAPSHFSSFKRAVGAGERARSVRQSPDARCPAGHIGREATWAKQWRKSSLRPVSLAGLQTLHRSPKPKQPSQNYQSTPRNQQQTSRPA